MASTVDLTGVPNDAHPAAKPDALHMVRVIADVEAV
jgi:hypothetical protein